MNVIYMTGNLSDLEYAAQAKQLNADIAKAKAEAASQPQPASIRAIKDVLCSNFLDLYSTLSKEDRRRMWRSLIAEIYVDGTNVTGIKPRL